MLTVQHLSRLGPQGAIVSKGAGPPPLVTGRRVKPIIGEAWEIQYRVGRRVGRGRGGTPSLWKSTFFFLLSLFSFSSLPKVRSTSGLFGSAFVLHLFLGYILCVLFSALIGPPSPTAPAMWPGSPPASRPPPLAPTLPAYGPCLKALMHWLCTYVYILSLPRRNAIKTSSTVIQLPPRLDSNGPVTVNGREKK